MKLPRDLSGQRVAKALRRVGFQVEHQEGSHLRLSNGARRVTIPLHSALLPKTLQRLETGRTNNRRTYARPLVRLNRNTSLDASIFALPLRSGFTLPAPCPVAP